MYDSEATPMVTMGKRLVAARDLPVGHAIRREDVAVKPPGSGLQPYEINKVIGRTTRAVLKADDAITFENLNGAETWAKAGV